MLCRFAGDDRLFGAIVSDLEGEIQPGCGGRGSLTFPYEEAEAIAVEGALFKTQLGTRLVGIGYVCSATRDEQSEKG